MRVEREAYNDDACQTQNIQRGISVRRIKKNAWPDAKHKEECVSDAKHTKRNACQTHKEECVARRET